MKVRDLLMATKGMLRSAIIAGALAWLAYASVETLLAVVLPRALFASTYIRPSPAFTIFLVVVYPLIGGALGGLTALGASVLRRSLSPPTVWATAPSVGLAMACLACAARQPLYTFVFVAGVALLILVAAVRRVAFVANPWTATILLLGPLWLVKEMASYRATTWKALAATGLVAGTLAASYVVRRVFEGRASTWVSPAAFGLMSVVALVTNGPGVRDVAPQTPRPPGNLPNVVLVVLDTVRADHLSLLGYQRPTAPGLQAFAQHAAVYRRAYSPANATLPAHASLFTGLWPSEHGAYADARGWRPLDRKWTRLPELLASQGYATASVAANYNFLGQGFGLDQGFQFVDVRPPAWTPFGNPPALFVRAAVAAVLDRTGGFSAEHLLKRTAEEINTSAVGQLQRFHAQRRPFFLFVNYMDAHSLCKPPEPFASMFGGHDSHISATRFNDLLESYHAGQTVRVTPDEERTFVALYDAAIAYEDAKLAELLEKLRALNLFENTLIVVTADHGETFGARGIIGHGTSAYDDQIRVPLIVKWPSRSDPSIHDEPISTIAIHDWVLQAAGVALHGDKRPVVTEAFPLDDAVDRHAVGHSGRAVVDGRYKLIEKNGRPPKLYDLLADPDEETNLANVDGMQPTIASLRRVVAGWRQDHSPSAAVVPVRQLDGQAERRLRSLGYVR